MELDINKIIKDKWILLFAIIIVSRFIGYSPIPQIVYIGSIFVAALYVLYFKKYKLSQVFVFYIFIIIISILVNMPPDIFSPWSRLLLFVIMIFVVSPLKENDSLIKFRNSLLNYCFFFVNILTIGSFFCYFLGINLMQLKEGAIYEDDFSIGGTFAGLYYHSMVLGPMSGLSLIYYIHNERIKPVLRIAFIVMSIAALLFSASRGAILASGIAVAYSCYYLVKTDKIKLKVIILLGLLSLSSISVWEFALNGIIYKQTVRSGGESTNTRNTAFENRLNEFYSSPIIGIGFAAIDIERNPSEFRAKTSTVEYGSSWLAVLSTTGILGLLPVVLIYVKSLRNSIKSNPMITSCLILFSIHLIVEGYMFSAGNPLCLLFWLFIGSASLIKKNN